jgi:hypothetical protein
MKRSILLFVFVTLVALTTLHAADNFQAPVPEGGKSVSADNPATVNYLYENLSFQSVADFYEGEVKQITDTKWHDLSSKGKIVIYDWGSREWHRINITDKGDGKGVLVTIRKDSWTWIIGTLIIRFIGVFIVLIVLMIALFISGKLLPLIKDKPEAKKA